MVRDSPISETSAGRQGQVAKDTGEAQDHQSGNAIQNADLDQRNDDEGGSESDSDSDSEQDGGEQAPAEVEADELEALRKEAEEAGESLDVEGDDGAPKRRKRRGEQNESERRRPPPMASSSCPLDSSSVWESFKAETDRSAKASTSRSPSATNPNILSSGQTNGESSNHTADNLLSEKQSYVKVVQTYRFAGDDVTTEKILPTSHPDAESFIKKQKNLGLPVKLLSSPEEPVNLTTSSSSDAKPSNSLSTSPALTSSISDSAPSMGSNTSQTASASSSNPPPKPGPRRKKGSSLAALNAAVNSGKAPKMNTLEKSKLDWEGWKAASATKDAEGVGLTQEEREEMEAQTKGGGKGLGDVKGYMERRNFLERVGGRLEDKVEESTGRRR